MLINPFTAPACKISGLKDAQTCLQTVYFLVLYHIYFQCYAFWWKSFQIPVQKRKLKDLRVSKLALLLVVFKWHHGSERVNSLVCQIISSVSLSCSWDFCIMWFLHYVIFALCHVWWMLSFAETVKKVLWNQVCSHQRGDRQVSGHQTQSASFASHLLLQERHCCWQVSPVRMDSYPVPDWGRGGGGILLGI